MSSNAITVRDPNRSFSIYGVWELFHKETNPNGIVPNIDDGVVDWSRSALPQRITVVYPDGSWESAPADTPDTENLNEFEQLFGYGPGDASSSARLYVDTSVVPHRLAVDAAICFYGEEKKEVKIFLGTDIQNPANVISARYNSSMSYISDTIPLQLAAHEDVTNLAVKSVMEAHCSKTVKDGDLATLVVYNQSGSISKVKELVVRITDFIVPAEAPVNRVTQVELVSPFISSVEPDLLEVPINVPMSSLSVMARIHYADRIVEKSIDGAKIQLHGADDRVSTVLGQTDPLVLTYKLSANETSVDTQGGLNRHVSRPYRVRATAVEGSYSVKLFVVPQWQNEFTGYTLDYYLYDLDRGDFYLVTDHVEAGINAQPFDGLKYGELQRLAVAIDLDKVDPRLKSYRHVQQIGVSLMDDGRSEATGWLIRYDLTKSNEYGRDIACRATMMSVGNWNVDLTCGYSTIEDWLENVYYDTQPLFDTREESKALQPTHFVLQIDGIRTEYELSAWDDVLVSITGGQEGKSAVLEWKRKSGGTVLELGCSPMRIIHSLR